MDEEIQISTDENMYGISFEEENEQSFHRIFNDSIQIMNQDNNYTLENLSNSIHINQEGREEEKEEQQENSGDQEKVYHEGSQEETEEIQQPLYQLNEMDTEASIKTEVKQLIFTKACDEIHSKILADTAYEVEEHIENLKNQTDQLVNEIQSLEKEVVADDTRLAQIEEMLQKTNEMIVLLRENVDKLLIRQKDHFIDNFTEKCVQQQKILESIKATYTSKFKNGKQKLIELELSADQNTNLKTELVRKKEALSKLKKRQDDLQRILHTSYTEIERATSKKNLVEEKKAFIVNSKGAPKNELLEQKNVFQEICAKREGQIERFNSINIEKERLQKEIEESGRHLNEIKSNINCDEKQISDKFNQLNKLKNNLDLTKCKYEESIEQLMNNLDNINIQLNKLLSDLKKSDVDHDHLLQTLNVLKTTFIQKNDEKVIFVNETLEKRNKIHDLKIEIMKKQFENKTEHEKAAELENQYEETISKLNVLKNKITAQKENIEYDIRKIKADYYDAQSQSDKNRTEIKKKREYMLANAKFLMEKSENLRSEMNEIAHCVKNLQDENLAVKTLIEKKLFQLNEHKTKMNTYKQNSESNLKFSQKTTKRVQFNEVLSFKSATSSENSNLPVDIAGKLNTSLHDWLQDEKLISDEH